LRNGFYRNGVDNLLVEMGKWDLGLEDLLMVVNFFSKVTVDDEGRFSLLPATAAPGITLSCLRRWTSCWCSPRCRIPRIRPPSMPRPVQLSWYQADDEDAAIQALLTRDENQRAFLNTQLFAL
jgi:hypothetical protein